MISAVLHFVYLTKLYFTFAQLHLYSTYADHESKVKLVFRCSLPKAMSISRSKILRKKGTEDKKSIGDHRGQWDVMEGQWEVMGGP